MPIAADVRQSIRIWARSPALTATLVLTVAVGTGGTAAIFAFVGGLVSSGMSGVDAADATQFSRVAMLVVFASILVLLLACSTVAGLLLSRSSARLLETAVKVALGATRRRLTWQCLIDSLVITMTGGAIGVLFAWWTTRLFPLLFFSEDAEQLALAPDGRWLAAAATVWVVAMIASGMVPMFTVPQRDPASVIQRDASKVSNSSRRFRSRLVVTQIAACSLLIVLAGLIREDLHATLRTARGRAVSSLLFVRAKGGDKYQHALEKKAQVLPNVTGTAWISTLPAGRPATQSFAIDRVEKTWREIRLDVVTFSPKEIPTDLLHPDSGRLFGVRDGPTSYRAGVLSKHAAERYFSGDAVGRLVETAAGEPVQIIGVLPATPRDRARDVMYVYDQQPEPVDGVGPDKKFLAPEASGPREKVTLDTNIVSPDYFDVFADPPTTGRGLDARDTFGKPGAAVISEDGARTLFDGQAIGGALIDPEGGRIEIVGVVRADALGAAQKTRAPMLFLPLAQMDQPTMTLAIRTEKTTAEFRETVRGELAGVPDGQLLTDVGTLEEHLMRTSLAAERIATALVGVCALMALALSVAGVYAVMADLVVRRRRELALRIALGAGAWRLVGNIVREGLRMAAIGGAAGLAIAVVGVPILDHYGVGVALRLPGPLVIVSAMFAIGALVVLACALPAWRAVTVDPRAVMHDG